MLTIPLPCKCCSSNASLNVPRLVCVKNWRLWLSFVFTLNCVKITSTHTAKLETRCTFSIKVYSVFACILRWLDSFYIPLKFQPCLHMWCMHTLFHGRGRLFLIDIVFALVYVCLNCMTYTVSSIPKVTCQLFR